MPSLFVPKDGRITSQNVLSGPLAGSEVMEIVSPGNEANGNTYQIQLSVIAAYIVSIISSGSTVTITSGATLASPYDITTNDTAVLLNKTVSSDSYLVAPLAASMTFQAPLLVKDLKGNADSFPITISFTGGELCDGLSEVIIDSSYGWTRIVPVPGGGAWYQA